MEEGVERIGPVDGVVVRLCLSERDAQGFHGSGVGGGLVCDCVGSACKLPAQRDDGAALG